MGNNLKASRLQQLEAIERDYVRLKRLIDYAAKNQSVGSYAGSVVFYVDEATRHIVDATGSALDLLGFTLEELRTLRIDQLESLNDSPKTTYVESSQEEDIYHCSYKHRDGYLIPVKVIKRRLVWRGKAIVHYFLEEQTLHQRVWHELNRREDSGFQFQQKLKTLNEISLRLNLIESFDEMCWLGVKLGIEQLGFDRISLWFLDVSRNVMAGSFGVDEQGRIRDERGQSWTFDGTHVMDFLNGNTDPVVRLEEAPVYNEKSEIIGFGWHISVPMLNSGQFIGFMAADNFIHHYPMKNYEPELLRLYGISIGHLTAITRARQQTFDLRIEQERVQMLKAFIRDVGHDFRTPLSVINISSYRIRNVQDDEQKNSLAQTIQEQVRYVNRMIDDMLGIIEMQSELALNLTRLDIGRFLEIMIQPFHVFAAAKRIQLHLESKPGIMVQADTNYLEEALGKIINNAIQYTQPDGEVRVSLRQHPHEVGICIRDNGIGIEKQNLDKVFRPLYRVNAARTNRGSGLGLSIARIIVEAHHGRITAESVFGQGSVFEVILPRQQDAQTA